MDRLTRYLAPSKRKLAAKGVTSVRSRVCNLADAAPGLTVDTLRDVLCKAFEAAYGPSETLAPDAFDPSAVDALRERYASWDWRFGKTPAFDVSLSERFDWGEVELLFTCRGGCVAEAHVYTDAMDDTFAERAGAALLGAAFTPDALAERAAMLGCSEGVQMAAWLRAQSL